MIQNKWQWFRLYLWKWDQMKNNSEIKLPLPDLNYLDLCIWSIHAKKSSHSSIQFSCRKQMGNSFWTFVSSSWSVTKVTLTLSTCDLSSTKDIISLGAKYIDFCSAEQRCILKWSCSFPLRQITISNTFKQKWIEINLAE